MQAAAMQIIYKGVFQWFLKLVVGVPQKGKAIHHPCQP